MRRFLALAEPWLARTYHRFRDPPAPNLAGDRDIEHTWIAANLPARAGTVLDFGSGDSTLWLVAVRRGLTVTAVDVHPAHWHAEHPSFRFVQGDVFALDLPLSGFDVVINCSTVEHVGLGRYNSELASDGDLGAMRRLRALLRPDGVMLLTVPIGTDAVVAPLHRVYGRIRLPRLLDGFASERSEFWIKDAPSNRWQLTTQDVALTQRPSAHLYALGCFVLRRNDHDR